MRTKFNTLLIRYRREISAISAGLGVLLLISIIRSLTPAIPVQVLTQNISAGHKISAADLTTMKIPESLSWQTLLTSKDQVIGKISSHAISAGQPLSNSDLITTDLLSGFQPSQVAISIPLANNRIDAYLTAGNRLDVFAAQAGTPAILVAHNAVVLFVPPTKSGTFQLESSSATSLILAVDFGESATISEYIGNGVFSFVLLPNN